MLANWDNDLIISIHAPRTGSDNTKKHFEEDNTIFQSTLPARGATETWQYAHTRRRYFNPRSLHGERHIYLPLSIVQAHFNPRSLHGERRNASPCV